MGVKFEIIKGESIHDLDMKLKYLQDKYFYNNFKIYFRNDLEFIALVRYDSGQTDHCPFKNCFC